MGKKRTYYKKQQIPFFISKLSSILQVKEVKFQNSTYKHIISWSQQGNTFIINDQNEFIEKILPQHFKHNNMASFVRQLNIYGFHKLQNAVQYLHQNFKRGQPEKCKLIKRIINEKPKKQNKLTHKHQQISEVSQINSEQLQMLVRQNIQLKKQQKNLLKNKKQGQTALKKLKNYVENIKQVIKPHSNENLTNQFIQNLESALQNEKLLIKNSTQIQHNQKGKQLIKVKQKILKNKGKKKQNQDTQQQKNAQEKIKNSDGISKDSIDDLYSPNSEELADSLMNSYFS